MGGGFGGLHCARRLERRLSNEDTEIVLINRQNFGLFYPLVVEAGIGSVEPRHVVMPIRRMLSRTRFVMGDVIRIDAEQREVTFRRPNGVCDCIEGDHLVIALGADASEQVIPGLREHAFRLRTLRDAVTLRDHILNLLEQAELEPDEQVRRSLLRLVVIGANFTGVEAAGGYTDLLKRASRLYDRVAAEECEVVVVETDEHILEGIDRSLARYAEKQLTKQGVQLRLGRSVKRIEPTSAVLSDGEPLASRTVLWCAGVQAPAVLDESDLPRTDRGYVDCEPSMRVKGFEMVWAIGDCASNPGPDGSPYPPTAQIAVKQAKALADNIIRCTCGRPPKPCQAKMIGQVASIGPQQAVASIKGVKLRGFIAWLIYRLTYIAKMPSWSRRFRIAADWSINAFFTREHVQLGLTGARELLQKKRSSEQADRASGDGDGGGANDGRDGDRADASGSASASASESSRASDNGEPARDRSGAGEDQRDQREQAGHSQASCPSPSRTR